MGRPGSGKSERGVSVAAVVLAAGGGARFAGTTPKLLAPFRGRPLVWWAVRQALDAGLDETVVVTGAVDVAGVVPEGARLIANPRWAEGQATSLAVAVDDAAAHGYEAIVVGLGDQPLVPAAAWRAVAASRAPVAVATYASGPRNPVRLARSVWAELPREGDEGARVLMRRRPELVERVACQGDPVDIDTAEDLERWS